MIATNVEQQYSVKFPRIIDFEASSSFFQSKPHFEVEQPLVKFDLSETYVVHSAFIGYLIDLKRTLAKKDKRLSLCISPELGKLFESLDLYNFFDYSVC